MFNPEIKEPRNAVIFARNTAYVVAVLGISLGITSIVKGVYEGTAFLLFFGLLAFLANKMDKGSAASAAWLFWLYGTFAVLLLLAGYQDTPAVALPLVACHPLFVGMIAAKRLARKA